jgi:RecJ-like exonuclease
MTTKKPSLEAAFAIGRPARSAAYKTCTRCKGTGWWQLARKCFKCGGVGHAEVTTLATQIRDKRKHIAEVEEMIAQENTNLATVKFGKASRMRTIESYAENLVRLRAELAELEARS